jgi:hypothetical protein
MKRMTINSDNLIALELLIHKVGRKWKGLMRDLRSETDDDTWTGVRHTTFVLRLKGLSDEQIADLKAISLDFIERTTRPMIFEELRFRRKEGLLK